MARTPLTLNISGAKFRELRERAGLLQIEVEAKTEEKGHRVERSRLSLIETGKAKPTSKQLVVLLSVFEVQVDDVLAEAS
ncbi:helix-turn-helix domain-containing protein [Amycolatopsis thailandensis]|uniref:helix-turn-helix domain-containing protein n=1 Tax=Amycolatopsis thailandensis TaxID=589330 RepID=UPI00378A8FFD